MRTIALKEEIDRNKDAIMCPCNGYAERVESTKEEIKSEYNCGRPFACCVRVFVCKACGQRIVARAAAPEMDCGD